MRKAIVAITPQVWYAWWNCSSLGYIIAASMMIHQPVKNCTRVQCQRNTLSSGITGYKKTKQDVLTYQNSGCDGGDGVSLLTPVHITLAITTSDPVQKPRHTSDLTRQRNTCYFWDVLLGFIIKDLFTFLDDEVNLSYSDRFGQRN